MVTNQYTKNIPFKDISLHLRDQYLDNFSVPPSPSKNTQQIGDMGYALIAKNIKWDCSDLTELLGISLSTSRIFITNPHSILPTHKDCVGEQLTIREWAINIPLFNCDKGHNVWYNDSKEYDNHQRYSWPSAMLLEHPRPIESYRERLDTIKLIRTDIFHGVDNSDNTNYRVVLSLRSDDNISWTEMCERIDESF